MAAPKINICDGKSAAAGIGGRQTISRKLDTCGCCFLCLNIVAFKTDDDAEHVTKDKRRKVENTKNKSGSQSVSLKSLRRYLKIDTDKLSGSHTSSATTGDTEDSSPSLKKEKDIKVDLCNSCARIVNKFSSVFSTLEMIQVEVHYWLEKVHKQIPDGIVTDSSDERVQNYYQRRMTTMTTDTDNESPDLFVLEDELRKEISMKCSNLKTNLEAKVELDSTGIPAAEQHHFSTVFILLEDEPNNRPPPSTSFQKFITEKESSSDSDEFEGEDAEYFPSPEGKKDEVRNISESESSSSEFEGEEDTEYFPIPEEVVKKPSKRQNSAKSATRRGRGGPPLKSGNDKLDQTVSSVFNSRTRKFNCKTCYRQFKTRALATAHYKTAHLYVSYECKLCRVTCSSLSHLNRHKKNKHGDSNEENPSLSSVKIETETEDLPIPTSAKERKTAAMNASIQRKQQRNERKKFYAFDSETNKYKCSACEFQASTSSGAVVHYEAIHLKKGYECDICGATLSRSQHLTRHKLRMHAPGRPIITAPPRSFPKDPVPKVILNPETGKYRCRECSEEFATQYFVYAHFEANHTGGNIYKCDICNVLEFKVLHQFKAHQKICRDSLQKRLADKQRRESDPSFKFPCPTCGKRFKKTETLNTHQAIHVSERNHLCEICQKRFVSLSRLNYHKKCIHSGRRFCCKICSKEYRSRTAYRNHEQMCVKANPDHPSLLEEKGNENDRKKKTVSKEEMFIFNSETGTFDCSVCQSPFKSEIRARVHYGVLHHQKRFLCDLCGKSFARQTNLCTHKKQCTGVKPEVVFKKTLLRNLTIQKRLDEMKRKEGDQRKYPFRCSTCGLRFTRLYNLQQHQRRIHQNQMDFECEICQRKFKYKPSLRLHKKIVHFGKVYECQFCKKEYKTQKSCQEHEEKCRVSESVEMKVGVGPMME